MVLLEVPEGRHKVAHCGSGGEAHQQVPKPRRGGTRSQGRAAPTGLDALPKPSPTTSVVGYDVSSLRDWAGGCSRPAVTTGKISGLATTVGFGCGSAALCLSLLRRAHDTESTGARRRQAFLGSVFSRRFKAGPEVENLPASRPDLTLRRVASRTRWRRAPGLPRQVSRH
jgi:hypothetical protein